MMQFLKKIAVTNYKSYEFQEVDFHPKLNAILGLNGVGKTNLLDAIYYSCLGKSYFSSGDRYVVRKGQDFFRIVADFNRGEINQKFVAKVKPGKLKELSLDGKKIERVGDHIGNFPCVIIAPLDIHLLLEGSEPRRNFMNFCLIQSDRIYIQKLIRYTKVLKQRNALLKDFNENQYYDQALLASVSKGFCEPAQYIYNQRAALVTEISKLFSDIYRQISGQREKCEIRYKSSLQQYQMEDIIVDRLDKDRIMGRTTQGVHRDDLIFLMNDTPIKPFGSQGQLKSFVIALKLAQYQYLAICNSIKPLLLLDDLFDKLDNIRVAHLLSILHEDSYGQVFITDKDKKTIINLLKQISSEYAIFAIDENTSQHSEEE